MLRKFFLITLICLFAFPGNCQDQIFRIDIEGNDLVSDSTIVSKVKIRAGQPYNKNVVNEDVKNLYATGFFGSVEAEKKNTPEGIVVIFKVKEKSVLRKIVIEGARFIRSKKILEAIDIKEGSFIDDYRMNETVQQIKDLYAKKGFTQAEVSYQLNEMEKAGELEARFVVNEKGVLKVRRITAKGNQTFSSGKIIRLMKTRKAWLFNKGIFDEDKLRDDIARITDFYRLEGFSDAEVTIDVEQKPKGIYLVVVIDEGKRYHVGDIKIEGNQEISLEDIISAMRLKKGSIFSEQTVYEDSSRIREVYVDKGYIFSQVEPRSFLNPQTDNVDLNYKISENEVAYIEDVSIKGNVKTKDKVIRRELRVYPGEKFDGKRVRKSKERLENLGFFEGIRFGTEPGSESNQVDLIVDVKEAKTGYVSFGGGYSSIEEFIGFIELRQRNFDYKNFSTFTGAGQDLSLMVSLGTLTNRFQLSFTNPWIFDKPVSFGFDAYKKGHDQDEDVGYGYAQDIIGGVLRLGREFSDTLKGQVSYRIDSVEISDIVSDATQELKDEEGTNILSSGEVSIAYDSRNNVFSPSKGILFTNNLQLTGGLFGGDKDFLKYSSRVSFYFPVINKSVIELRLRTGFADPFSDTEKVPIYERFFAGGTHTIRGYPERKVGPIDAVTDDPIGGEAMFIGNIEYTYPLADFIKVATFFDTGNVWKENSDFLSGNLKSSIGLGLRVKTPIGPVSVDYGWPLDTVPGEDDKEGRFHFSVSRGF